MTEKDFDEIIRKAASSNLKPDDCFNWENMHIPIPKRKQRRSLFILLFWGLGISYSLGILNYIIEENNIQQAHKIVIYKGQTMHPFLKSSTSKKTLSYDSKKSLIADVNTLETPLLSNTIVKNKKDNQLNPDYLIRQILPIKSIVPKETQSDGDLSSVVNGRTIEISNADTATYSLQKMDSKNFSHFSFDSPNLAISHLPPTKRKNSWFLRGGYLTHRNLTNHSGLSNVDFGQNAPSYFIAISKHHIIKSNWYLEVGLSFSRLNYFYEGFKNLGYNYDVTSEQRISSRRIVKHNNFIEIAELQIGIGKSIPIATDWKLLSSLSALPGLAPRRVGRIFLPGEESPIDIEEETSGHPITFSCELMAGLQYQVLHNIGIGVITSSRYYFTSIPILNEEHRPFTMNIGVALRIDIKN